MSRCGQLGACLVLVLALGAGTCAPVLAAELRVFCASPLREPVLELARGFARASGHRIAFVFASVGAVHKRIASGERADMAIGTLQGANALVGLGRGVQGSQAPIVRSTLALVLAGAAARPDVGDVEALETILRGTSSLVMPDAALGVPGGAHAAELLEQLGIREALRAKTRLVADAREVVKQVAAGSAQAGLGAMSEMTAAADVAVVGPLVEPRPAGVVYAALTVRGSAQADTVREFVAHLRSPQAAAVFRKAGYLHVE
jgi:molybdate transport system substrate-binding protein